MNMYVYTILDLRILLWGLSVAISVSSDATFFCGHT